MKQDQQTILYIAIRQGFFSREVLRGVLTILQAGDGYEVWVIPVIHEKRHLEACLESREVAGVITRGLDGELMSVLQDRGIPVMAIRGPQTKSDDELNHLHVDDEAIGGKAGAEFERLNLDYWGFVHWQGVAWSEARKNSIQAYADARRARLSVVTLSESERYSWDGVLAIQSWLKKIPKPCGVLACNDEAGVDVLHACKLAGLSVPDLAQIPTFIGLAGVVDQDIALGFAQDLPLANVQIEDDRRTAMVGALGASDGCVIGIGTGSFLGRRVAGKDLLIGGWGLTLGDDASGAFLGRQLLRRVLETGDGMHDVSLVTREVLAQFGSTAAIVAFAGQAQPSDFAEFAPRIIAGAGADDPTAVALVREGVQYIERALGRLGWRAGERICPIGGVAPHYAPYLAPDIASHLVAPEGTALDGALILAAQMGAA